MNSPGHLLNLIRRTRINRIIRSYTLLDTPRINAVHDLAQRIESEGIPGDVVECGAGSGGASAIYAYHLRRAKANRTLWLFDSFQGMPPTTQEDGREAGQWVGQVAGSERQVREVLAKVNANMSRVRIVPGWFQDTLPAARIHQISLLSIDADWYASVKTCLENFYEAVAPGGYIYIDDYGYWPGCRKAVHEYLDRRGIRVDLHRVDTTGRWFRKPESPTVKKAA